MRKRVLSVLLAISLVVAGCSSTGDLGNSESGVVSEDAPAGEDAGSDVSEAGGSGNVAAPEKTGTSLITDAEEVIYYDPDLVPSVPDYQVASDLSNVTYHQNFAYLFEPEYDSEYNDTSKMRNALMENGFAVRPDGYHEFFDVYEMNRYNMFPNFVTVDSLMHTYHIYFSYLLRNIEKESLSEKLKIVSTEMLARSTSQYESLKGTDFEEAALRNVALFYVGAKLQDPAVTCNVDDSSFAGVTDAEYNKIMEAAGIDQCLLTGLSEDYSQYKPRGYYDGDETLEAYFRAMMWYGRISFALESEEMVKSAVLMTSALSQDDADYNSMYDVTSFFAGVSDDFTYGEMAQVLEGAYGKIPDAAEVSGDAAAFGKVVEAVKKAEPPKINGIPVLENEENVIPSFRFMGQRFTVDAAIMQNLIYRAVEENPEGERRYLPDALDTAAALGSEEAYKILDEQGDTKYKNYTDNLKMMQDTFNNSDSKIWGASLYAGWLNTLRPLFEKRGEGYPFYMQNDEWNRKKLETFAGSYAELKHDTILYAKQVAAEMGGGDDEMPDDRGYVDPEPVIYSRFIDLSNKTSKGLEAAGMLTSAEKNDLALLSDIAKRLLDISEKELKNEALSDDDYEFIRGYGGNLEHFWQEVNAADGLDLAHSYQAPCPVIADIATDPNGTVLEVGSGRADTVFVVFPIDGELHVGSGSAYSFYQFTVPIDQRMTDEEFRSSLEGGYLDDDWNWVENDNITQQPDWTQSYRIVTGNR